MATIKWATPPSGLFHGHNFMTPKILGYVKLAKVGGWEGDLFDRWAELSEGTGITHEPIFGVTVRPEPEPRKSQMFWSRGEAEDYIRAMV